MREKIKDITENHKVLLNDGTWKMSRDLTEDELNYEMSDILLMLNGEEYRFMYWETVQSIQEAIYQFVSNGTPVVQAEKLMGDILNALERDNQALDDSTIF